MGFSFVVKTIILHGWIALFLSFYSTDEFFTPTTCAALQQAAASGEVDHDLWGRELTYISGKMPDKLLFQGAPEAAVYPAYYRCFKALLERQLIFMRHNAVNNL